MKCSVPMSCQTKTRDVWMERDTDHDEMFLRCAWRPFFHIIIVPAVNMQEDENFIQS